MELEHFNQIQDPEVRAWAMIWKVANELQGFESADSEANGVIDEIIRLRSEGKLTDLQKEVLFEMGLVASTDPRF